MSLKSTCIPCFPVPKDISSKMTNHKNNSEFSLMKLQLQAVVGMKELEGFLSMSSKLSALCNGYVTLRYVTSAIFLQTKLYHFAMRRLRINGIFP